MLAGRVPLYWFERVNPREPLRWLECVLNVQSEIPQIDKAYIFNCAGNFYQDLHDVKRAKIHFELALPIFQSENHSYGISRVLNSLGNIAWSEKNFEKARELYDESLIYDSEDRNTWGTLINLGSLAKIQGSWEESRKYYIRARETGERLNSETVIAASTLFLATLDLALRKLDEARKGFESGLKAAAYNANLFFPSIGEGILAYIDFLMGNQKDVKQRLKQGLEASLEYLEQSPNMPSPWIIIEGQARLDVMEGHMQRAAQLFGTSWVQRDVDDSPLTEFERSDYEACIVTIRSVLGDDAYNKAFEKGKAMTLKGAIAYALEES
jgi:tetratricopeptide (TPR) repeat protein